MTINPLELSSLIAVNGFIMSLVSTATVVYTNADTKKLDILRDNRGRAGVYRWVHKKTENLMLVAQLICPVD